MTENLSQGERALLHLIKNVLGGWCLPETLTDEQQKIASFLRDKGLVVVDVANDMYRTTERRRRPLEATRVESGK